MLNVSTILVIKDEYISCVLKPVTYAQSALIFHNPRIGARI